MKPKLLDLFCGAGGAGRGYIDAGFDVWGVDNVYQPNYPGTIVVGDALSLDRDFYSMFSAIHASPPCQKFSKTRGMNRKPLEEYPDYIIGVRELLISLDVPYVLENVVGAPLIKPIMLCGSMFDLPIERHRLFELGKFSMEQKQCDHDRQIKLWPGGFPSTKAGRDNARVVSVFGKGGGGPGRDITLWSWAMGIDWMFKNELADAIPPKYTEYIGSKLLRLVT